jgi:hypothetical protein
VNARLRSSLAAWIGIPLVFAAFAKLTYVIVEKEIFRGFFPTIGYWLVSISAFVLMGVLVHGWRAGARARWQWVIYVIGVVVMLVAIQGTTSCLSGDCF